MTTTGAQDVAAGLLSILDTYKAAHPTHIRKTFSYRPGSYAETPCAYIDLGPERIHHDAGTRQRTFSPVVTWLGTFSETDLALRDAVRDGLVDAFTAGVSVVPGMVIVQTGAEPSEETVTNQATGTTKVYPTLVLTFEEIVLQEGRV